MGSIVTGKVTGITKFGAFVTLAPGKSGLVHISEIANSYVNDIREHLTEGQEVTVKVIGLDDNGRINLSIKAALPPAPKPDIPRRPKMPPIRQPGDRPYSPQQASEPSFEDKLKRFMQDSDSKISGIKQYADKKNPRRRGGR
ncbi:S1 RNA binding domain protein [Sporobacter termitidis DSM 10068]|uniref:S1 RNA binding domain protein n=1 Tax=Sporobacter termitidis DSM 10068 TaxID=1123282 RepID=A0A1M5Z753_9FIRM|nr:S1 RNA binding domain protein [Sporobacter termitidis DSM 10068]